MPGDATSVGSIIAYLSMDRSNWKREIDAAKREAKELGLVNPKISIEVNGAGQAVVALEAVDKAARKAADKRSGGAGLLVTSLLAIGPAAIPIAGVATAAVAGLGAAAGVAALGVLGIRDAMKSGNTLGQQYRATFAPIVSEFDHLKALAASGMFDGINAGVRSSQALFPTLNRDVALLSTQLGQIVGHVAPGLVALFTQLNPLFVQIGNDLVGGAAKFQQWAISSDAVGKFVAYAEVELPKVEQFLGQVATAVGHLVQGFAPLGSGTLSDLTLLLRLLNSIPIGVLQVAVPLITSMVLAFKGFNAASNAATSLGKLSSKLEDAGGIASGAAGFVGAAGSAMKGLGVAGLAAIPIIGAVTTIMGSHAQKAAEAQARINDLTQAIIADNGALGQNAQQVEANILQQNGMFDAAKAVGVNLHDLTLAALGNADAMKRVHDEMYGAGNATRDTGDIESKASQDWIKNAAKVASGLDDQSDATGKASAKARDLLAATSGATAGVGGLTDADRKLIAQTMSATTQLGFLNDALDRLSNNAISAEQIELRFKDALGQASQQVKQNGSSLDDNTAKGRANKEWLLDQITTINQHAEAVGKQTGSVKAATSALASDEAALRRAATAAGLNKDQVDALIRTYAATPKQVTTAINADTSKALGKLKTLQQQIDALHSKQILIDVTRVDHTSTTSGHGKLAQGATGGTFTGDGFARYAVGGTAFDGTVPGTGGPRADNQLALLSPGEEVIKNGPAQKHRALLKMINADKFADGGTVGTTTRGGKKYWTYNGILYSSQAAADNARTRAEQKADKQAQAPHDVTVNSPHGFITGIVRDVRGAIPAGSAAMRDLSAAMDKAFQLKGIDSKLDAARQKLTDLRHTADQFGASVTSNLRSGFNPATAGADVFGNVSLSGLLGSLGAQTSAASKFSREETQLGKLGLNSQYFQLLAQNGPSGTLDLLASLSKSQIGQVNKAFAAYQGATTTAGRTAESVVYGKAISQQQKQVNALLAQQRDAQRQINRLANAVVRLANRPVEIDINGKAIVKASSGHLAKVSV